MILRASVAAVSGMFALEALDFDSALGLAVALTVGLGILWVFYER